MVLPQMPVAGQDKVSITFWHMEEPAYRVERFQTLIDEFNAANPDIEVKQEVQNWGEVYTKAPAAVAAGNAPELLFAIPDFTPILKELGAVQPVEDFVAELDAEHKFFPAAIEQYTYDGHTWAVPMWNMAQSLWYRKSVFEEAGIEPPPPGMSGWLRLKRSPRMASTALASRPTRISTQTRRSTTL